MLTTAADARSFSLRSRLLGAPRGWIALLVCAALLLTFWIRAQVAISSKSSTYDEPMHAMGAWVHAHLGDWRINYEDPPLWHYWAALRNGPTAIKADFKSPDWEKMPAEWARQWIWSVQTLYRTPGNDGEAFVQRSRSMMIVLGVALGAVLAWWAWQAGGPVAAVAAAGVFALDPNFLAHAPLVKNDVPIGLCLTGLALALWRMGLRLTPLNLAGAALACAAAMTTKFTGVVLAPLMVVLLLTARALWPRPWPVGPWTTLHAWWQRLAVAFAAAAVIGIFSYAGIWAAYGFRFGIAPDPSIRLNTEETVRQSAIYQAQAAAGGTLTAEVYEPALLGYIHWRANREPEAAAKAYSPELLEMARKQPPWQAPGSVRLALWLLEKRLAPEAWLNGLLFVQARSHIRGAFLDGETSVVGFRSYFPKAMLYKTPLATLIALALSTGLGAWIAWRAFRRRRRADGAPTEWFAGAWLALCAAVPAGVFLAMSISSNLNIGHRHVLPVYPMLFLGIAVAVAAAVRRWRIPALATAGALAVGLAVESVAIAPDYLTFFNVAAGGQRGGLDRLGDSNLDWGQDLPLLAEWQKQNNDFPLYLSYFGMVDPAFYGIRYLNVPGGYQLNPQAFEPPPNAVIAVSATNLQAMYMGDDLLPIYRRLRQVEPTTVLGGSIYIFDFRKPLPTKK